MTSKAPAYRIPWLLGDRRCSSSLHSIDSIQDLVRLPAARFCGVLTYIQGTLGSCPRICRPISGPSQSFYIGHSHRNRDRLSATSGKEMFSVFRRRSVADEAADLVWRCDLCGTVAFYLGVYMQVLQCPTHRASC